MQTGIGQHFLEHFFAENTPVHDKGQHALLGPFHGLPEVFDHFEKTLAQIGKVVRRLKIERLSRDGVDKVAVHRFVGPPDRGTPSLQHVLFSRVMLGVRVQVEVALSIRAHLLGVEASQRFDVRLEGDPFQSLALGKRKSHYRPQQPGQVRPIEKLALLDIQGT